jgi:coproporphyrinogen III oxidase-like Fe-S oxidoreductase
MEITFILLLLLIGIILFFVILFAIKKVFEEALQYSKREITIELNPEEVSKDKNLTTDN